MTISPSAGPEKYRIAVLIDGDNAQDCIIDALMPAVALHGDLIVKRIYGDFTSSRNSRWKPVLQRHAIKPMQQFANIGGKNATDSALIIDAMDLLHSQKFNGFCIVSSDSDFTSLVVRLRYEGMKVWGYGEKKTPEIFQNTCDVFTFTEGLRPAPETKTGKAATVKKTVPATKAKPVVHPLSPDVMGIIRKAMEASPSDDGGWVRLGAFGKELKKLDPNYRHGFKKVTDFVKGYPDIFEVSERTGGKQEDLFVRLSRDNKQAPRSI